MKFYSGRNDKILPFANHWAFGEAVCCEPGTARFVSFDASQTGGKMLGVSSSS